MTKKKIQPTTETTMEPEPDAPLGARQSDCQVCDRRGWVVDKKARDGSVWVQCIGPCMNSNADLDRRVQLSNQLNIAPWDIEVFTYVNDDDVLVEKVVSNGRIIQETLKGHGSSA